MNIKLALLAALLAVALWFVLCSDLAFAQSEHEGACQNSSERTLRNLPVVPVLDDPSGVRESSWESQDSSSSRPNGEAQESTKTNNTSVMNGGDSCGGRQTSFLSLDDHPDEWNQPLCDSLFLLPREGCLVWGKYFTSVERARMLMIP